MSFCTEHIPDCLICYEGLKTPCNDIVILTDLNQGDSYWLHIYDRFDNLISGEITIGLNGALTFTPPLGSGKIYFYLSSQEAPGTLDVPVIIDEIEYYCFIYE